MLGREFPPLCETIARIEISENQLWGTAIWPHFFQEDGSASPEKAAKYLQNHIKSSFRQWVNHPEKHWCTQVLPDFTTSQFNWVAPWISRGACGASWSFQIKAMLRLRPTLWKLCEAEARQVWCAFLMNLSGLRLGRGIYYSSKTKLEAKWGEHISLIRKNIGKHIYSTGHEWWNTLIAELLNDCSSIMCMMENTVIIQSLSGTKWNKYFISSGDFGVPLATPGHWFGFRRRGRRPLRGVLYLAKMASRVAHESGTSKMTIEVRVWL